MQVVQDGEQPRWHDDGNAPVPLGGRHRPLEVEAAFTQPRRRVTRTRLGRTVEVLAPVEVHPRDGVLAQNHGGRRPDRLRLLWPPRQRACAPMRLPPFAGDMTTRPCPDQQRLYVASAFDCSTDDQITSPARSQVGWSQSDRAGDAL
ncbi:MAG TPA: hypothetical protein VM307_14545 [Egibacteraceae bacterium]|nr:hypothetical protein [Egibacteraceae bacterium]